MKDKSLLILVGIGANLIGIFQAGMRLYRQEFTDFLPLYLIPLPMLIGAVVLHIAAIYFFIRSPKTSKQAHRELILDQPAKERESQVKLSIYSVGATIVAFFLQGSFGSL